MKILKSKSALSAVVVAAGLFAASSAMAAVDMYLDMSGIRGESTGRPGQMDILAWSWGASAGKAANGKGTLPAACVQDISLTKFIDAASPSLIMNSMTGAVAAQAVLTVERAGPAPEYLVLSMTNVRVTSYSTGGSGGEDRLTENVSLHFETMTGEYTPPKGRPVSFTVSSGGAGCNR